ncbi:hypothetical protein RUM43_011456 [Polyplax serrata]|uniref:Uncharacterized protein n=1 Tax=Polyplax serrata TaxID=468196 RepID=A0AAN8S0A4_POLSC
MERIHNEVHESRKQYHKDPPNDAIENILSNAKPRQVETRPAFRHFLRLPKSGVFAGK